MNEARTFHEKAKLNTYDIEFIYHEKKLTWIDPWYAITSSSVESLQRELQKELSTVHPLYNLNPKVIARCDGTDDIFVALDGDRFAEVHLTWLGHIDQIPEKFPRYFIYDSITEFRYCKV